MGSLRWKSADIKIHGYLQWWSAEQVWHAEVAGIAFSLISTLVRKGNEDTASSFNLRHKALILPTLSLWKTQIKAVKLGTSLPFEGGDSHYLPSL